MEDDERRADMLSVVSHAFAAVPQQVWDAQTGYNAWSEFLGDVCDVLTPLEDRACVLENWLSPAEAGALRNPPSFEQKSHFAACHFTGGLPQSAVPVESLYRSWTGPDKGNPFTGQLGMYQGDSASYMKTLIERMGMEVPQEFHACPDHLSLETDMAAVLLRSGGAQQARQFMAERFGWLTSYRLRLLGLGTDETAFYVALLDVLMEMCRAESPEGDDDGQLARPMGPAGSMERN